MCDDVYVDDERILKVRDDIDIERILKVGDDVDIERILKVRDGSIFIEKWVSFLSVPKGAEPIMIIEFM